jgi:hypothetical protein
LIYITDKQLEDKHLLACYIPRWLHEFFLNPAQSQHFYSVSFITKKCIEAIQQVLDLSQPDPLDELCSFFVSATNNISDASHMVNAVKNI